MPYTPSVAGTNAAPANATMMKSVKRWSPTELATTRSIVRARTATSGRTSWTIRVIDETTAEGSPVVRTASDNGQYVRRRRGEAVVVNVSDHADHGERTRVGVHVAEGDDLADRTASRPGLGGKPFAH